MEQQHCPAPSCTSVPIDLCAACCFVKGLRTVQTEESLLEGVTELQQTTAREYLHYHEDSLDWEPLTFNDDFNFKTI